MGKRIIERMPALITATPGMPAIAAAPVPKRAIRIPTNKPIIAIMIPYILATETTPTLLSSTGIFNFDRLQIKILTVDERFRFFITFGEFSLVTKQQLFFGKRCFKSKIKFINIITYE